jgi:hypothetical protein
MYGQWWLLFSEHPRDGNLGGPPQQLIAGDNMRACDSRLSQSWRLIAVESSAGGRLDESRITRTPCSLLDGGASEDLEFRATSSEYMWYYTV